MQNYSSLQETNDNEEEGSVLVHVAEPSRARWNHIHDLDTFFSRMYHYHQRHGFCCMGLQEVLELCQFIFMVFLTCYVCYGINYDVLFRNIEPVNHTKITLSDVLYPISDCVKKFSMVVWFLLIVAMIVWIFKMIKGVYNLFYFWDIKQFYNTALGIDDCDLDNLTWHEIQSRVLNVQIEQQMCIHKRELTELDIYHRILRQQNYFVAMVNKRLLPPRLKVPFIKEVVYWTNALQFNTQLLFFWSPWAPFENPWHLRAEYKKPNLRHELSEQLGRQIIWLALINLFFAPLIILWYILYAFFNYAAIIRKEPGTLAVRRWSLYGKLYIRHFNELDHELQARLTRAHKPACRYCQAFTSSIGSIIAENAVFYITAILAVFVVLTFYDEDVLAVEHVLSIITVLSCALAGLRTMIPDETTSWDLQQLLSDVVIDTHYLPDGWKTEAHTSRIRTEFAQLFQYVFVGLFEGIISPVLTPYVLIFHIYPKRLDFVDFFRNFTVSVVGVGDVCSFAQMDIKKHGNPDWQGADANEGPPQYNQGEDGKVELSLMHFTYTNPSWKPPDESANFVSDIQEQSSLMKSKHALFYESLLHGNLDDTDLTEYTKEPVTSMLSLGRAPEGNEDHNGGRMNSMWRTEGPSPFTRRNMAFSITCIHNQHSQKTEDRHTITEETTPLLWNR